MNTVALNRTELAVLYWDTDTSVDTIAAATGFVGSKQALCKAAGPAILVGFQCDTCEEFIKVSSRADATGFLSTHKRGSRWGRTPSHECRDCIDRRLKQSHEEFEARLVARAERIRQLKAMPYRDYLQTDHWQETRKDALRRAKFCCQTCSAKGKLHVHHRTYVRRGEEWSSDLIVLCAGCHSIFHENGKLANGGRAA